MGKSPGEMLGAVTAKLQERTGKTVEEWARIVQQSGPGARRDRVAWLMAEHGLGRVAANIVVSRDDGVRADYSDVDALLAGMFAGPKAALRPLYDEIVRAAAALGSDVEILPCRTQVTLRRRRQFAWIKAGTNTRLDLGLALEGVRPGGRLLPIAGTNEKDRVRLRIAVADHSAIDSELKRWLKAAYDLDAR